MRLHTRTWLVLALAALLPTGVFAQPTISNVAGTLTHGSSVTITGTNFGTKAAQAPWKWDDMNGTNGQELDTRGWLVHTNTPRPVLSSSTELRATPSRTTSAFLHQTGANVPGFSFGDNVGSYLSLTSGSAANLRTPPTDFVLIDYWMYFVDSTSSNNYKFLRWHDSSNPGTNNRYWSMPGGAGSTESSTWSFFSALGVDDIGSRWTHHNIWLRYSSTQANNFYRHVVDGRRFYDSDGNGNYAPPDAGYSSGAWPAAADRLSTVQFEHQDDTTGGSPPRDGHMTISDVAIDDGVGAVYLANASTFVASTHTEYQPYTAWSSTSITVTLNRGTFGASDSVFLCVYNNSRQVSATCLALTLGGAGGAPQGPQRLRLRAGLDGSLVLALGCVAFGPLRRRRHHRQSFFQGGK